MILLLCLLLALDGLQDFEGAHQSFVYRHHGSGVVELAAIVWCGEERDELPFGK